MEGKDLNTMQEKNGIDSFLSYISKGFSENHFIDSDDPTYEDLRRNKNMRWDFFPKIIQIPEKVEEILHTLEFTSKFGIEYSVRSRGGSFHGKSVSGEIVIDMSKFSYVKTRGNEAIIGAGTSIRDIVYSLNKKGLFLPLPDSLDSGICGAVIEKHVSIFSGKFELSPVYAKYIDPSGTVLKSSKIEELIEKKCVILEFKFICFPNKKVKFARSPYKMEEFPVVSEVWWEIMERDECCSRLVFEWNGEEKSTYTESIYDDETTLPGHYKTMNRSEVLKSTEYKHLPHKFQNSSKVDSPEEFIGIFNMVSYPKDSKGRLYLIKTMNGFICFHEYSTTS